MNHFRLFQLQQFLTVFQKSKVPYVKWSLTLLVCLLAFPGIARIWYIAPATSGNGSANSWANASTNLTNALDNAVSGDQVWVKTGTYRRYDEYAFQIKNGVQLYGGFAGFETSLGQRSSNLAAYPVYITNSPTASGTNSTNMINLYSRSLGQVMVPELTVLLLRMLLPQQLTIIQEMVNW